MNPLFVTILICALAYSIAQLAWLIIHHYRIDIPLRREIEHRLSAIQKIIEGQEE